MKLILLLSALLACAGNAQIELKWEYRPTTESLIGPNPNPTGNPTWDLGEVFFDRHLTTQSGYTLAAIVANWPSQSRSTYLLVLLNPDGQVEWNSGDLGTKFPEYSSPVVIPIQAGPESAVAFIGSTNEFNTRGGKLLSYHKRSSPQEQIIVGDREALVLENIPNSGASIDIQSGSNGTTFYTVVLGEPPVHPGRKVGLRKYALAVSNPPEIIVPNESGIQDRNIILRWQSIQGLRYQIQEIPDLIQWSNVGQPMDGNGANQTWSQAITQSAKFFRVIQR